mgnify:CR=1 FL=1
MRCCAGGQTSIGEFFNDVFHRVLAGGVQLESELHKGGALFINADRADLAAFDAVDCVEVPDGGAADSPAVHRLLRHLVGDVGAVLARAVLVEGGEDAMHELPDWRRIDLLGR